MSIFGEVFCGLNFETTQRVSLFGTMHIATEVQQRGDLRGSGLTTQTAIQHRAAA